MTRWIDVIQKESCFQPGSTLCMGCMEGIAFQNIGKITDNGIKTIFTLGTFCGEVSTLQFPNPVAWGRGEKTPKDWTKSFGILHHVFESAPTVAEGVRDTADLLKEIGAITKPVQVCAVSGDGGALAIGLRSLLHTIHRRNRITIFVLVNEIFANTGFQYSPTTPIGSETSTTPVLGDSPGNLLPPLDYLSLCVSAGAGLVAQVSPAFPKYFIRVVEKALACSETAVVFIQSPCITGWKYTDGETVELARLGAETGFFPCFLKEKGAKGEIKFIEPDLENRPRLEDFLGRQRRFHHLVVKDPKNDKCTARPGMETVLETMRKEIQSRLETLAKL